MSIHTNSHAKEFIKLFKEIGSKYSYSSLWYDFVLITACSLSVVTDSSQRVNRLTRMDEALKRYSEDEQNQLQQLFAITQDALKSKPDQDFLGEIYGALGLYQKSTSQFFTPYNVSKMMALMILGNPAEEIKQKGMISINDPCCGAGAMLIAAANACQEQGVDIGRDVLIVAQDIDPVVALMCYIQLFTLECAGFIRIGNTMKMEPMAPENTWLLPGLFQQAWVDRGVMEVA